LLHTAYEGVSVGRGAWILAGGSACDKKWPRRGHLTPRHLCEKKLPFLTNGSTPTPHNRIAGERHSSGAQGTRILRTQQNNPLGRPLTAEGFSGCEGDKRVQASGSFKALFSGIIRESLERRGDQKIRSFNLPGSENRKSRLDASCQKETGPNLVRSGAGKRQEDFEKAGGGGASGKPVLKEPVRVKTKQDSKKGVKSACTRTKG